ncbi:MAG TPA: LacI family DNA-binding transcriptional regulator [Terracidiphilus sp.]|nr:LacI family DNA-binding transcriptional regulator [Terracidiphilus sp.]
MTEGVPKTVGIKQIAAAAGISIGTVDRALHNRPGVNPKTRARVLKIAERLGYKPNLAARSLKLNRRLRIAVHLPQQIASFFDSLRDGIRESAAAMHGATIDLTFRTYPHLGEGDIRLLEDDLGREYDGLIMTPSNPAQVEPLIRRYSERGTAVVCVASDAPRAARLASVSVDAAVSGSIAAELLGTVLQAEGAVATITGDLNTLDHGEKLRGFAAALATMAPHLTLIPAIETHESPKEAYRATLALLKRKSRPVGIYINTANSLPVLRAIDENGMWGRIRVVTTDLFTELVPLIESARILATLYQRPFTQGKLAFETLCRHLVEGIQPEPVTRVAPHIILRSNLPLFIDRLPESMDDASERIATL